MISIAIMSFILSLAAPSFSLWMATLRVRNIAESVNFGIIQARAESIRRNQNVVFTLNGDTSWSVTDEAGNIINQKAASESSSGVQVSISPTTGSNITFTGMGAISATNAATPPISIDFSSSFASGQVKALRVKLGSGGASIVCDPDSSVPTTSVNYCRDV